MLKSIKSYVFSSFVAIAALSMIGCDRVQPNEIGVLVQNYGKDTVKDYSVTSGKVLTIAPGTTLYKLPAYEQRNKINTPINNKSSDNIQFSVTAQYSYRIDPKAATRVIKEHSQIFNEGNDMEEVEKRSLYPAVKSEILSIINNSTSTVLMVEGGNTAFNKKTREQVTKAFKDRGFILLSFSTVLDYSDDVKKSIEARNSNTSEIQTLDSKIDKAKKETILKEIETKNTLIANETITEEQLKRDLIEKWNGVLPSTYICNDQKSPLNLVLKQ